MPSLFLLSANRSMELNFAFPMMSGPRALGMAIVSKQAIQGVKPYKPESVLARSDVCEGGPGPR